MCRLYITIMVMMVIHSYIVFPNIGLRETTLDLAARLDIAIDVAHAITYLHMYAGQYLLTFFIVHDNENCLLLVYDFAYHLVKYFLATCDACLLSTNYALLSMLFNVPHYWKLNIVGNVKNSFV